MKHKNISKKENIQIVEVQRGAVEEEKRLNGNNNHWGYEQQ